MKKLFILLVAAAMYFSCAAQEDSGFRVKVGDEAPQFTVDMFDGSTVNTADLEGKVVLVNFWATWCPPCRAELARVQTEIIDRFAGEEFVFLPISRGEETAKVKEFRETNGYTFPMGLDPDQAIFNLYAEKGIPRNVIIGRDGRVAFLEVGYTDEIFCGLIAELEKELKK